MPKYRVIKTRFKIRKWKWYLVDLRDFHHPVIVRKHLDSKEQAINFKKRHYDKYYDVIHGVEVLKHDLKDYSLFSLKRHKNFTIKFTYPPDRDTDYKKKLFRTSERNKMKQKKRLPKVTETAVWELIDDKPVRFIKLLQYYRDHHWAYSEFVEGSKRFKKEYEWPEDVRLLSNIVRTLRDHYDLGLYDVAEVAIFIYKKWGKRVRRHMNNGVKTVNRDMEKVVKEFKARGFIEKDECNFDDMDDYIETIHIKPRLAHPEVCWHDVREKDLYDHYLHDFQAGMGIPGYTRCHVGRLEKS